MNVLKIWLVLNHKHSTLNIFFLLNPYISLHVGMQRLFATLVTLILLFSRSRCPRKTFHVTRFDLSLSEYVLAPSQSVHLEPVQDDIILLSSLFLFTRVLKPCSGKKNECSSAVLFIHYNFTFKSYFQILIQARQHETEDCQKSK